MLIKTTKLYCSFLNYMSTSDLKSIVLEKASGREEDIVRRFANVDTSILDHQAHPCPTACIGDGGGKDRFNLKNDDSGVAFCRQCMTRGTSNFVQTISWLNDEEFEKTLLEVAEYLGIEPSAEIPKSTAKRTRSKKAKGKSSTAADLNVNISDKVADLRNVVYSYLQVTFGLSDQHREALRKRGLTDSEIDRRRYSSAPKVPSSVAMMKLQLTVNKKDVSESVPGVFVGGSMKLGYCEGLMIPVRDVAGRVIGVRYHKDDADANRYAWLTSSKQRGPSPGTPAHSSIGAADDIESNGVLRVTEGPLKADAAYSMSGTPTIGIVGVTNWPRAIPHIDQLKPSTLLVAMDSDLHDNSDVAGAIVGIWDHYQRAAKAGQWSPMLAIETWPTTGEGKQRSPKGIDDALLSKASIDVLAMTDAKDFVDQLRGHASVKAKPSDPRQVVEWSDNELELVLSTIKSLEKSPDIFQRGSQLYDVTESAHPLDSDESILRVRELSVPHLRTVISSCVRFVNITEDGDQRPKRITDGLVKQVKAYGSYGAIRELHAVSEYPFMRPDGTVCDKSGYDAATKTLVRTHLELDIPKSPTRQDAIDASNRILSLVADFEFKSEHHKSAWLAGLLTVFAKPSIRGCCPLNIIEASVQGSGKTRLVDVVSTIATGRALARNPWPSKDEEVSKQITAITISGIPLVLFDNAKTIIGGQSIEALGTAETWKARILGESKESDELPIRQVYFLTGNNCSFTLDVARRTCFTRLEPTMENPDERDGFTIPDLLGHIAKNRTGYVRDALTILLAFHQQGQPQDIKHWGGFENWSKAIREPIFWIGLPDPYAGTIETKASAETSDVFQEIVTELINANLTDASAKEICEAAGEKIYSDYTGWNFVRQGLNECLTSACGDKKLTPMRLGKILQRYDGRIFDGKKFYSYINNEKSKNWLIEDAQQPPKPPPSPGVRGLLGVTGSKEVFTKKKEREVTAKENPTATLTDPGNSLTPGNCCQPNCKESDRKESTEGNSVVVRCGVCGRHFGRRPIAEMAR